jgi:MFS family permease
MRLLGTDIYYGWWILACAVLSHFMFTSLGQMVSGVFLDPIVEELEIKVWLFAAAVSAATGVGGIAVIFIGPLVDRISPRRLILSGAVLCALGLVGLSWQSSFVLFFVFQTISRALGLNLFGGLVVNATLTKWFIVRRGWALAIGSMGVSLAGIITPITMTAIIDSFGWRTGYLVLAASVILIIVPISFVMKRQPEDMGLLPDGKPAQNTTSETISKAETARLADDQQTHTRAQAIRTHGFWLLTLGYGLNAVALGSVILYAIPFATAANFTRSVAAVGLGVNGVGNLTSKGVWGWSLQRIDARRLAGSAFSISACGVLLMVTAAGSGNTLLLMVGFFLYGFGFGGTIPISEFLWARYFGRRHIGSIRGIGRPITLIFSTVGPIAIGLIFDIFGSYNEAFLALAVIYIMGAICINASRIPQPPTQVKLAH